MKPATARPQANPEPLRAAFPRWHQLLAALLGCLLTPVAPAAGQVLECSAESVSKQLVIIIDDLGINLDRGQRALALPGNLTFAVIPYTRYGRQLAREAEAAGKEVMLHTPMSNLRDIPLGRGGLTAKHSKQEFRNTLAAAFEEVPQARGINNHMGSDLTQRRQQMAWLMQELRGRDMYFVDSRTSDKTVAATVAAEFSVPHLSRQVFLDNERSTEAIDERFQVLLTRLEDAPVAVAIGHPYPETIAYLQDALPRLEAKGIKLAFVSEVLEKRRASSCNYSLTSTPRAAI